MAKLLTIPVCVQSIAVFAASDCAKAVRSPPKEAVASEVIERRTLIRKWVETP